MDRLHMLTGTRRFSLIGDNMAASRTRLMGLCEELRVESAGYLWDCSLTVDRLELQDFDALWAAGCRRIFVGLESGSQEILDRMRKGIDLKRSLTVLVRAVEIGFLVETSFIVGFPWETQSQLDETYKLHGSC
jgi:radical SAM superfamily enzyme YgiQ (UPF0313 family)